MKSLFMSSVFVLITYFSFENQPVSIEIKCSSTTKTVLTTNTDGSSSSTTTTTVTCDTPAELAEYHKLVGRG